MRATPTRSGGTTVGNFFNFHLFGGRRGRRPPPPVDDTANQDLEALALHKSGCVWFKKGDIQRTLNKN